MTRNRPLATRTGRSASSAARRHDKETKDGKKYKVEFKLVHAEKKRPLMGKGPPPRDYRLVGTGNAEFTSFCKDKCQKSGRAVWVNNEPDRRHVKDPDSSRVGFHVRRDGYWFPRDIVKDAERWFQLSLNRSTGQVQQVNSHLTDALKRHSDQDEIAQVYAAMSDLFPKMPRKTALKIVKHSFINKEKNGGKPGVGTANMSLPARVQLAVNAYIRHTETDYDSFLKKGVPWHDARAAVGPACIEKLMQWRGEDGKTEFEDTFEEWIDLRDDDSDGSDESNDSDNSYEPDDELQLSPAFAHNQDDACRSPISHNSFSVDHGRLRRVQSPSIEQVRETQARIVEAKEDSFTPRLRSRPQQEYESIHQSVETPPTAQLIQVEPRLFFTAPPLVLQSHFARPEQMRGFHYVREDSERRLHTDAAFYDPETYARSNGRPNYAMEPFNSMETNGEIIDLSLSPSTPRTTGQQQHERKVYRQYPIIGTRERDAYRYDYVTAPSQLVKPLRGGGEYSIAPTHRAPRSEYMSDLQTVNMHDDLSSSHRMVSSGGIMPRDQSHATMQPYLSNRTAPFEAQQTPEAQSTHPLLYVPYSEPYSEGSASGWMASRRS